MLHLAQVKKNPISGEMELQLLAYKQSQQTWEVTDSEVVMMSGETDLSDGLLVLVELGKERQIIKMQEAKDWILSLIEKHLSHGAITPEFVQQEQARVEQWRQEITAQSLDLTRRHLEVETQREQIQELEASLKREKENLEIRWQQIQDSEARISQKQEQ